MKPAKAREIIKDMLYRRTISLSQDQKDALGLGDEALERIQYIRLHYTNQVDTWLPSETKD